MILLRAILMLVILVILAHMGITYMGIDENQNDLTRGIVTLGMLLEIPAQVVIDALPTSPEQERTIQEQGLYFIGFAAVVGYFILFLLLGVGRR
jgi:hypothetical protein